MKTAKNLPLSCQHSSQCGSCSRPELSLEELSLKKQQILRNALSVAGLGSFAEIPVSIPETGFRERVDLILEGSNLGYLQKNSEIKSVFHLLECELLTPELMSWVTDFQKTMPIVKRGSVRLRASPSGLRGAWLDFANIDIAELLKRETELSNLLENGIIVEIGQRRKRLRRTSEGLKLREPAAEIWTETYTDGNAIPLFSLIGNFTQTGRWAHRLMSSWVENSLLNANQIIEFGSGIGTLTLPAAGRDRSVLACEVDELALECLRKSLENKKHKVEIWPGDFQLQVKNFSERFDSFLVNPPRSGLGAFVNTLAQLPQRPRQGLYMSCYLESFLQDALALQKLDYRLEKVEILDQFPWTDHFEILANFSHSELL